MSWSSRTNVLLGLLSQLDTLSGGRRWFVGGGFAVDLSLGRLSRDHDDIDLFVEGADAGWWREAFASLGLTIGRDDYMRFFPGTFVAGDALVEVWPLEWRADGYIVATPQADHPGREWWRGMRTDRLRDVRYGGALVRTEDPDLAIDRMLDHVRHHRERLAAKHLSDLTLTGRVAEYERLIKELGI